MAEARHVLIVDDEQDIRETIEDYLTLNGFVVHMAANGEEMRNILQNEPIHVALLDLRMPGEDGFSLCRYARDHYSVGIVMLTGSAETTDKVVALEMGADDYIAKPFDLRELLARVKSVARRVPSPQPQRSSEKPGVLNEQDDDVMIGECRLSTKELVLQDATGEVHSLTTMEYDLLKVFVEHPDQVLTRDQLMELAHNRDFEPFDRSVDVRITRLRKKIERDPTNPRVIRTVHGIGYVYSTETD